MLISECHSDGPSAGTAEASGPSEAHGPHKVHGPRGHCTPLPPILVALAVSITFRTFLSHMNNYCKLLKFKSH